MLVNGSCQRQPVRILDIRPPADDGNTTPARSNTWVKAGRWSRLGDFSSFGSWQFLPLAVRCLPPGISSSAPSSAFPRYVPPRDGAWTLLPESPQATLRIRYLTEMFVVPQMSRYPPTYDHMSLRDSETQRLRDTETRRLIDSDTSASAHSIAFRPAILSYTHPGNHHGIVFPFTSHSQRLGDH